MTGWNRPGWNRPGWNHPGAFFLVVLILGWPTIAGAQSLDHYTLVMGWQPGRCIVDPNQPECANLSLRDSIGRNLSLIGLKPQSRSGSVMLKNCDAIFRIFDRSQGTDACAMPGLRLSEELATELSQIMPGTAQCRDRHFWSKYGSCSMLSQEMFFRRAVDRALEAQRSRLNAKISGALGGKIGRADIIAAFTDEFGLDADRALQLICTKPKQGGQPILVEVLIFLTQIGTMHPLSNEGLWGDGEHPPTQRCPEEILVPAPLTEPRANPAPPAAPAPYPLQPYDPTKPQPMQVEPDIIEPLFIPETTVP